MKLDLDISVFSRFFRRIAGDLAGQKRLWPVAAALLVGIVAVPILLTKSSSAPPAPQTPLPAVAPSTGASLPTINVQSTPTFSHLTGKGHNPFATPGAGGAASTSSSTSTLTSTGTGAVTSTGTTAAGGTSSSTSTGSSSTSTGSGSSTSTSAGGGTATPPPSITGNSKPKPAPTGLSSTQSYDVAMAITNSAGGVGTVDPLARLSLIPSKQQQLLVELGVLKGKSQVLFAVEPGTVVAGPGTCTPGPIDCEILSLGLDQTEAISNQDSGAHALFAITGVTAVGHSSVTLANLARHAESAAGRAALNRLSSTLAALSLFKYEPSVGAIVDLRDLTVGG